MPKTEWIIKNTDNKSTSLLEKLLTVRGMTKKMDIEEFLNPMTMDLSLPDVFLDMPKAVDRIVEAIKNKQHILIYGDFDADGITSTSLLCKLFSHLKADFSYYIPQREADGHGLNSKALVRLMADRKPKLIITVDCGVSNVSEVAFLKTFKIDCIITDHHEASEILPDAVAIINPKAQNSLSSELSAKKIEHLTSLAGCGVAFKLAQALLIYYNKTNFIDELLPFVAVGTVADVVPLIGENRYFVQKGLDLISKGKHYGLKRLLEVTGCEEKVTSEKIGFTIAPRINACGRLDNVEEAMKFMISENKQEIEMAIISLNNFNKIRQDLCDETFAQAEEMYLQQGDNNNAVILFDKDWNIGIIGIVASKMVEKYYKPAFLMTYSEKTQQVRCSARSIKGVHLYDVICNIEDLLDGFGGHEMAAGFSFNTEKTSFEVVKKSLLKIIDEVLNSKKLVPIIEIDCELQSEDVDFDLIEEINKLEPFGESNEHPVFSLSNLVLKQKQLMGSNKNHLRLILEKGNQQFNCIWWGHGDISLVEKDTLDIAFCPQINVYKGNIGLQLILKDIHSEFLTDIEPEQSEREIKVFNHKKKTDILPLVNDYCKTSNLDIIIFAQHKNVLELLKPYKALSDKVVGMNNLRKADSIMFFDYPCDEDCYNKILEKVEPKQIHYMSCEFSPFDEKEIIKTLSGMIKFVCNNKDGKFEICSAANFLALNKIALIMILNIFEESKLIKIINKSQDEYELELIENADFTKVLHCEKYADFVKLLREIEEFRKNLFNVVGCEV